MMIAVAWIVFLLSPHITITTSSHIFIFPFPLFWVPIFPFCLACPVSSLCFLYFFSRIWVAGIYLILNYSKANSTAKKVNVNSKSFKRSERKWLCLILRKWQREQPQIKPQSGHFQPQEKRGRRSTLISCEFQHTNEIRSASTDWVVSKNTQS